jgi:hypothetical protein
VEIREAQRLLCERIGCQPDYVAPRDKLGAAPSLFKDEWPIKGIRHLAARGTCGWYIWAGEYSDDPNFFQPQHAEHVFSQRPEITGYLGLPPGWGFIIAPGYEDVWHDETLMVE